ncbi:MAG TPA: SDR family NAD(P)-dependent oxidoreductase, partial [Euzebyales bacterium]|nr:SDR family NAD(P)-dependent oxidoreductase [Euzebyales bacterium]
MPVGPHPDGGDVRDVSYDHSGRVVAVTGAATGIGRATAAAFAESGADVVLLDIDEDAGRDAAAGVGRFVRCDVTSPDEVDRVFDRIGADHGRLDVLVNNAGGFWTQRTTEDLPLDEWDRVIALNLTAVYLTSRRAVSLLRASPAGRIVNLGSLAGQVASFRTSPAYAAAKAGVHALTRIMATELAPDGITVNAIAPSAVLTERIRQVRDEGERAATAGTIPLCRYQDSSEIASWILFLASSEAVFATWQTLSV